MTDDDLFRLAPDTRNNHRIAAGLCLTLALVLHAWQLDFKSIWIDEAVGWRFSQLTIPHVLVVSAGDVHSPLYYLLLKTWVLVAGDSPIGLRSLSVAASLLAVFFLVRLAATLPRALAVAAVLWYVLSPQTVYLAQEARMYAPLSAAVLATALAYRRWIESGFSDRRALTWYVVGSAVAIYLHLFAILGIAAMALHFLLIAAGWCGHESRPSGQNMRDWFKAQFAVFLAYWPWLPFTVAQIANGQSWRQTAAYPEPESYVVVLFRRLFFGSHLSEPPPEWQSVALFGVLLMGIAALIVRALRKRREADVFFVLLAIVPCAIGLLARPFAGQIDLSRYLAYAAPLMMVACARGLADLQPGVRAAAAAIVVVGVGLIPAMGLRAYYAMPVRDYDVKPLVDFLAASPDGPVKRGDEIIVVPGYTVLTLRYVSRDTITYDRVEEDEILKERLRHAASERRVAWLIVDYRWWMIRGTSELDQFDSINVPGLDQARIRLFKTRVQ